MLTLSLRVQEHAMDSDSLAMKRAISLLVNGMRNRSADSVVVVPVVPVVAAGAGGSGSVFPFGGRSGARK
jgi:hypothetical protein